MRVIVIKRFRDINGYDEALIEKITHDIIAYSGPQNDKRTYKD
jgi:hypothetical protein